MSNDVERGHARSGRSLYVAVLRILGLGLLAALVPVAKYGTYYYHMRGGASESTPTAATEWPPLELLK